MQHLPVVQHRHQRLFLGWFPNCVTLQNFTQLWNHPKNRRWRLCTKWNQVWHWTNKLFRSEFKWDLFLKLHTWGFWEGPNPNQKCRLLLCGFENWTFYVMKILQWQLTMSAVKSRVTVRSEECFCCNGWEINWVRSWDREDTVAEIFCLILGHSLSWQAYFI